jgi:hypothetical protein
VPDVTVAVQTITRAGLTPTYATSLSTGDNFYVANDGEMFLHVTKGGAGNCTVTVVPTQTVLGLTLASLTVVVVATTGNKLIGPFPPGTFNDAQGRLLFTISDATGLSVAAFHL